MQMLPEKLKTAVIRPPQSPGEELDRELARGILDGNEASLGYFVDRHLGPLTHYLERRLGAFADDRPWSQPYAQGKLTLESALRSGQADDGEEIPSPRNEVVNQIAQATFRDAFNNLRPYAFGIARTPMRLWLFRRAERHIRRFATSGRERHVSGGAMRGKAGAEDPSQQTSFERGSLDWLRQSLDTMPRRQQAALSLALFERLTPVEIGFAMGVRPARAMRLLRSALLRVNKRILAVEGLEE